jgi:hypothetical protein
MPHRRLSSRRLKIANALIIPSLLSALAGCIAARLMPSSATPWLIIGASAIAFIAGLAVATNKVKCEKCGKIILIIGEGGPSNCGYCTTPYFE